MKISRILSSSKFCLRAKVAALVLCLPFAVSQMEAQDEAVDPTEAVPADEQPAEQASPTEAEAISSDAVIPMPADVAAEENTPPSEPEPTEAEAVAPPAPRAPLSPLPGRAPQPPGADEFLPPSYEPRRYAASWSNSPFEREILPPVVDEVEEVNELNDYRVVGIGKLRGKYLITLVDKKGKYSNVEEKPNKDGLFVVSVADGTNPQEAEVVIKQGELQATIGFDENNLKATPKGGAGVPAQGRQPNPAVRQNPAGNTPQPNVPTPAQPQAGTPNAGKPAAQGNQALIEHLRRSTQAPNPATPQGTPDSPPKRRRVVLPPSR